ncbi:MAG: LuxR C-terminal-related transcriptional regulator [Actinomycetales bacterium]
MDRDRGSRGRRRVPRTLRLRSTAGSEADIDVVGTAADGHEALTLIRRTVPDVVLMDLRMPRLGGIDATRAIVADPHLARVHVLVLTTFDTDDLVDEALAAGAHGLLLTDTELDDLLGGIRRVAAGDTVLSPVVLNRVVDRRPRSQAPGQQPAPSWLATLTPRERDVLLEVAGGLTNAEIAQRLFVSPATVKTHVANVLAKTGARDRVALVAAAYAAGLVGDQS